ncbi:MAG: hypothetical protein SV862_00020 [Pseudomonadota bacterium]|nr:hypothetical protein [Pseudomonadota bacterium]
MTPGTKIKDEPAMAIMAFATAYYAMNGYTDASRARFRDALAQALAAQLCLIPSRDGREEAVTEFAVDLARLTEVRARTKRRKRLLRRPS